MGTVTVSGTCIEKFGDKKQRKVEKILRHPIREKKHGSHQGAGIKSNLIPMGKSTFLLGILVAFSL